LKDLYRLRDAGEQLRLAAATAEVLTHSPDPADRELLAAIDYQRGVLLARETELRGSPSARSPEMRESELAYQKAIRVEKALVEESLARVKQGPKAGRDLEPQRTALGRYRNNLGKMLDANGRSVEAEEEFRAVLALFTDSEKLAGPRWQRARAAHNLGQVLLKPREGMTAPERKTRAAEGWALIQKAKERLEGLGDEFPEVPQYREELASVYANLGMIEQKREQYPQAVADLELARGLADRLVAEFPTVPKYRVQAAEVDRLLASYLRAPGDAARAEEYARASIRQLTELAGQYPEMPSYLAAAIGRSECQLAKVLMRTNRVDAALAAAESAAGHHRTALKSSPESPKYRQNLWEDQLALSMIRLKHGDAAGAAADAEDLPVIWTDNPDSYLQAAFLLVQCAEASPEQKAHLYDRAMKVLGEGVSQGILDPRRIDQPRLGPLHDREDFRRLRQTPPTPVAG
jgi:tetratricopeptide (TPR) repeat protein